MNVAELKRRIIHGFAYPELFWIPEKKKKYRCLVTFVMRTPKVYYADTGEMSEDSFITFKAQGLLKRKGQICPMHLGQPVAYEAGKYEVYIVAWHSTLMYKPRWETVTLTDEQLEKGRTTVYIDVPPEVWKLTMSRNAPMDEQEDENPVHGFKKWSEVHPDDPNPSRDFPLGIEWDKSFKGKSAMWTAENIFTGETLASFTFRDAQYWDKNAPYHDESKHSQTVMCRCGVPVSIQNLMYYFDTGTIPYYWPEKGTQFKRSPGIMAGFDIHMKCAWGYLNKETGNFHDTIFNREIDLSADIVGIGYTENEVHNEDSGWVGGTINASCTNYDLGSTSKLNAGLYPTGNDGYYDTQHFIDIGNHNIHYSDTFSVPSSGHSCSSYINLLAAVRYKVHHHQADRKWWTSDIIDGSEIEHTSSALYYRNLYAFLLQPICSCAFSLGPRKAGKGTEQCLVKLSPFLKEFTQKLSELRYDIARSGGWNPWYIDEWIHNVLDVKQAALAFGVTHTTRDFSDIVMLKGEVSIDGWSLYIRMDTVPAGRKSDYTSEDEFYEYYTAHKNDTF